MLLGTPPLHPEQRQCALLTLALAGQVAWWVPTVTISTITRPMWIKGVRVRIVFHEAYFNEIDGATRFVIIALAPRPSGSAMPVRASVQQALLLPVPQPS